MHLRIFRRALIVVGLLLWQKRTRRQVKQARVVKAPVARRGLIVTAAIAGPTVLSGFLGAIQRVDPDGADCAAQAEAALAKL